MNSLSLIFTHARLHALLASSSPTSFLSSSFAPLAAHNQGMLIDGVKMASLVSVHSVIRCMEQFNLRLLADIESPILTSGSERAEDRQARHRTNKDKENEKQHERQADPMRVMNNCIKACSST